MPDLRYGRLVWTVVKDRNGFRKKRPGIIVTPTDDIDVHVPLVIVAVTTSFSDPPPSDVIELPWHSDPRRVMTRLARRSAAVPAWLETIYPDEIDSFGGDVPAHIMAKIETML